MKGFATITTFDYLPKCLAMASSIHSFMNDIPLNILVIDRARENVDLVYDRGPLKLFDVSDLQDQFQFVKIKGKYASNVDKLRWTSKPCFLKMLLERESFTSLFYIDNDIFFFQSPAVLFDEFGDHAVMLSPHWRCLDPMDQSEWFDVNFTDGVYNAGLIGVSKQGAPALDYWARACAYKCEKNFKKGRFDDQKYLDLIPAAFEDVAILKHRGCNVAFWNRIENKRTKINGELMINEKWPLVFVHFTRKMIAEIEEGNEPLLQTHLDEYQLAIETFNPSGIPV